MEAEGPGPLTSEVAEAGDGNVVISYRATAAGDYQLSVRLAGSADLVGSAPHAVQVTPDVVAVGSSLVGAGLAIFFRSSGFWCQFKGCPLCSGSQCLRVGAWFEYCWLEALFCNT